MFTNQDPTIVPVQANHFSDQNKICWQAIFGGVVVAILTGLVLNLLGIGLGFAAVTPDAESAKTIGTMGMVWMFVSGLISMYMGGWVASQLGGVSDKVKGYWQGFIVAGVSLFILLYIATSSIGSLVSGSFSVLGQVASTSGDVIGKTAGAAAAGAGKLSDTSKDDVVNKAKDMLPASFTPLIDQINYEADLLADSVNDSVAQAAPSPQQSQQQIDNAKAKAELYKKKVTPALHNFFESIGTDNYEQAKNDLVDAIAQASGKSPQEVQEKVNAWQKSYEDAKAKALEAAKNAAQKTSELVSKAAITGFILILASIIAAGLGGVSGANLRLRSINSRKEII